MPVANRTESGDGDNTFLSWKDTGPPWTILFKSLGRMDENILRNSLKSYSSLKVI